MAELSATHTITNPTGMHARPCSLLVQTAAEFESDIEIEYEGIRVSAKSILGLLTLAAGPDQDVTLYANGPDAEAALKALGTLIENNFGEE